MAEPSPKVRLFALTAAIVVGIIVFALIFNGINNSREAREDRWNSLTQEERNREAISYCQTDRGRRNPVCGSR